MPTKRKTPAFPTTGGTHKVENGKLVQVSRTVQPATVARSKRDVKAPATVDAAKPATAGNVGK